MCFCSTGAAEDGRAPTEEHSCVKGWCFCSTGRPRTSHLCVCAVCWQPKSYRSTENRTAILQFMATCVVSYVDTSGIRHSVEVEADSMYEAAVMGVKVFRQHDCEPLEGSRLEIE